MQLVKQEHLTFHYAIKNMLPDAVDGVRGNAIVTLLLDSVQQGRDLPENEFNEVKVLMYELSQFYYADSNYISNETLTRLYPCLTKLNIAHRVLEESKMEGFFVKIYTPENLQSLESFNEALGDICHMVDVHVE